MLHVRTLQLGMVRADEGRAAARLADERALSERIRQLADGVAPVTAAAPTSALSIMASAHFREKLVQTAQAAEERVDNASRALDHARERTQAAKRDQSAMEKLIERAGQEAARRAMRALETLGEAPPKKRHDPC